MPQSATSQPATASSPGRRWHILYAEDVPELRDLTRMTLSLDGHSIDCAVNGQLALARTDHHMPTMNGLEFVAQLRAINYPGKIVVFSSELKQSVHDAYMAFKVDAVLPKPIFPSELRRVLAEL